MAANSAAMHHIFICLFIPINLYSYYESFIVLSHDREIKIIWLTLRGVLSGVEVPLYCIVTVSV